MLIVHSMCRHIPWNLYHGDVNLHSLKDVLCREKAAGCNEFLL